MTNPEAPANFASLKKMAAKSHPEKICTPPVKAGFSFDETEKKAVTFQYIRLLTGLVVQLYFAAPVVSAITASLPGITRDITPAPIESFYTVTPTVTRFYRQRNKIMTLYIL